MVLALQQAADEPRQGKPVYWRMGVTAPVFVCHNLNATPLERGAHTTNALLRCERLARHMVRVEMFRILAIVISLVTSYGCDSSAHAKWPCVYLCSAWFHGS